MSDTTNGSQNPQDNQADKADGGIEASEAQPHLQVLAQYIKDLSFENPRVPEQLPHSFGAPEINISVNVNARPLEETATEFEIELTLEAKAQADGKAVFIAELIYGARLKLTNVPDDMKAPLTMIEGPRILFPFARRILADMVRDGGYPQLLIEPIDFAALFQHQMTGAAHQDEADTPVD